MAKPSIFNLPKKPPNTDFMLSRFGNQLRIHYDPVVQGDVPECILKPLGKLYLQECEQSRTV